jgi:hypothetical protein
MDLSWISLQMLSLIFYCINLAPRSYSTHYKNEETEAMRGFSVDLSSGFARELPGPLVPDSEMLIYLV